MRGIALSLALACALPAAAQVGGAPPPVVAPEAARHYDKPQGVYAGIEIRSQQAMIARLRELIPTPRREAIAAALGNPAALSPPALYALANAISQDDARVPEAVFWYHVGRIRAVYDALRCKDPTARGAVTILGRNLNPDIARYQRQNRQHTLDIAEFAIKWDQQNPRDYDQRWVNLYGKVARESAGTDPAELSVPEAEWPAILQRVHEAHLKSVREFAAVK